MHSSHLVSHTILRTLSNLLINLPGVWGVGGAQGVVKHTRLNLVVSGDNERKGQLPFRECLIHIYQWTTEMEVVYQFSPISSKSAVHLSYSVWVSLLLMAYV